MWEDGPDEGARARRPIYGGGSTKSAGERGRLRRGRGRGRSLFERRRGWMPTGAHLHAIEGRPSTFNFRRLSFRDEDEIVAEIRRKRSQWDNVVVNGLKDSSDDFKETNGVVEYKGMVYVPKDRTLRERIIAAHHDTTVAGHPGRHKTVELIRRSYWWPSMAAQVARLSRPVSYKK